MRKLLACVAIATLFSTASALAATQYFVGQKASDKSCSVVTTKPDGKTMMMVGKSPYKTEGAATTAMKAAAACKK
jgi:hypothetical protein